MLRSLPTVGCALAVVAAGCATVSPYTGVDPDRPVVLGATFDVFSSWAASCDDTPSFSDHDPHPYACKEKPVHLEVVCGGPCGLPKTATRDGATHASVPVIALALGTLGLDTTSIRMDNRKVHRKQLSVLVVPPERLELSCLELSEQYPHEAYLPCGPRGVPAERPLVQPHVFAAGHEQWSTLLRVNGLTRRIDRIEATISLADLVPEAREGDGVRPGSYRIELELDGLVERFQIEAR